MEIFGFSLWTILLAILVIVLVSVVLGFIFGEQTKAKLSDKLAGQDWKVRSETAFPMRHNCSVHLYNDAAVDHDNPPEIVNEDGDKIDYTPGECWKAVFNAINEAQKFVYITGWSVDTTKSLLRTTRNPPPDLTPDDPSDDDDETLGELLRRKAEQGCHVCVHVWNEKMSVASGGEVKSDGLMCTHDEDTKLFFEGTPVNVVLSYREGDAADHSFIFTHHQKSIIVDAPLLRDAEKSHEEGLEKMRAAKLAHIQKRKELKALHEERRRKRKELKKRKEAGEDVEIDSDSSDSDSDEDFDMAKWELKMKKKEKKRRKKEKKLRKQQEKREKKERKKRKRKEQDGSGSESEGDDDDDDSEEEGDTHRGMLEDVAAMADINKYKEKLAGHYEAPEGARRIIAFVGGLDLCDGRWDTPRHSLFRTLKHEHFFDFHNPWAVSQACGPREPWHDIHCKLEGAVCRDVLENFVQRWHRQAPDNLKDTLLDFSAENGYIPIEHETGSYENQKESWNVQLFRSIDKFSATIDGIDASIQESYINSIRCAQRFIYVENQYFLGSCKHWEKHRNAGCENLIPFELANKICSKIREKKQFNVYILIPMYPEGIPEDGATQEILFWQYRTQGFMNKMVWKAIEDVYGDDEDKPVVTDYLNFYCLGQRETPEGSEAHISDPAAMPKPTENDLILGKTRRFSIYVHSKMMIVDDAYVIVGSANINERSLSGYRDSEIAMGAYQPAYPVTKKGGARGEVHKFRMSLWHEHLGLTDKVIVNPNSAECARFVNKIAERNWEHYNQEETRDMISHLMHYPIRVDPSNGKTISTCEFIPDTKGTFKGAPSLMLVDKLTT